MPSQVRIFTSPRALGETLSESDLKPSAATPRTVPEFLPELPKPTVGGGLKARHYVMEASHEEKKPKKGGVTYAHQDELPKLPIPDLEQTCQKYLAALKPLQTPREHAETRHAVQEFLKHEGPELNEKLKKYAEGRTSYIEQFCKFSPHANLQCWSQTNLDSRV